MKFVFYILSVSITFCACSESGDDEITENTDQYLTKEKAPLNFEDQDTTILINQPTDSIEEINEETILAIDEEVDLPGLARFSEFPGNDHFNGKPLVQQLDLSKKTLEESPDTLSNLAMESYKGFEGSFPTSISCNFDEGTSKEHISYPKKLIFRFQIFENEFATKPYLTKDVVVKRTDEGVSYTE